MCVCASVRSTALKSVCVVGAAACLPAYQCVYVILCRFMPLSVCACVILSRLTVFMYNFLCVYLLIVCLCHFISEIFVVIIT